MWFTFSLEGIVRTSQRGCQDPSDREWLEQHPIDLGHVTTDDTYDLRGYAWPVELYVCVCVCVCV